MAADVELVQRQRTDYWCLEEVVRWGRVEVRQSFSTSDKEIVLAVACRRATVDVIVNNRTS